MNTWDKLLNHKKNSREGSFFVDPGFYDKYYCAEIDALKQENKELKARLNRIEERLGYKNAD